jgi:hypothetical protein
MGAIRPCIRRTSNAFSFPLEHRALPNHSFTKPQQIELTIPEDDGLDRVSVEEQLTRILHSQLFRNSDRYTGFLRYVVETALRRDIGLLKERLIGINVFGRDPSYDTAADNVVRMTAAEVRSRLVQYYAQSEHSSELRIILSRGSYVPHFVSKNTVLEARGELNGHGTPLEKFWRPIIDSFDPALIALGSCGVGSSHPGRSSESGLVNKRFKSTQQILLLDALTLSQIVSWLQLSRKSYRVEMQPIARLQDLRGSPLVLIGPSNNRWMSCLGTTLRFGFGTDATNSKSWIRDRENSSRRSCIHDSRIPVERMTEDYAIVGRILNPETGQPIVLCMGHTMYGTAAAVDLLTRTSHFDEIARRAPADWHSRNLEAVIATNTCKPRIPNKKLVSRKSVSSSSFD